MGPQAIHPWGPKFIGFFHGQPTAVVDRLPPGEGRDRFAPMHRTGCAIHILSMDPAAAFAIAACGGRSCEGSPMSQSQAEVGRVPSTRGGAPILPHDAGGSRR